MPGQNQHALACLACRQVILQPFITNKVAGVFVSGKDKQVSYASQAWMVLGGVATKAEGAKALGT